VDVVTAPAAAVDEPRASAYLYVLGVAFVSREERSDGGFLAALFYHSVVVNDGYLASASGNSAAALFGSPQSLPRFCRDHRRGEVLSGRYLASLEAYSELSISRLGSGPDGTGRHGVSPFRLGITRTSE
jgi:hypothetical protein